MMPKRKHVWKIWFKPASGPAEVVDWFDSRAEANRMLYEYKRAFGKTAGSLYMRGGYEYV